MLVQYQSQATFLKIVYVKSTVNHKVELVAFKLYDDGSLEINQ